MTEVHFNEVLQYCPAHVRGNKLLILHRLAMHTNSQRLVWVGIETLMHETHASQSTVYEVLSWLRDAGIIQDVDESTLPDWAKAYPSVFRRLSEPEYWTEGCPAPIHRMSDDGKDLGFQNPESLKTSTIPKIGPYKEISSSTRKIGKKTSSSSAAPTARRVKPTRAEAARRAAEDEDERDPYKQQQLAEERESPAPPEARTRGHRDPGPDTGMGLAAYFIDAVSRVGAWHGLSHTDQRALATNINRWKRAGTSADEIRAMIDLYTDVDGLRNPRATPWKDFASKRFLLKDKLRHEFEQDSPDEDEYPVSYQPKTSNPDYVPDPIWG